MRNEVLSYDDLLQIVELIKSADAFSEFHLKVGDIELELRKAGPLAASMPVATAAVPAAARPQAAQAPVPAAPAPSAALSPVARAGVDVPAGSIVIKSPMVGTFYRSPEPGAAPFVEVGQSVSAEMTVCIIEVMKLMNSISAGCTGKVTHVFAGDAEPVAMGQVLIVIDPKG
ncbi:MAG: acetyl-CoA carboxylase biotin carboxyl carrier protein [Caldimonas sp.]